MPLDGSKNGVSHRPLHKPRLSM